MMDIARVAIGLVALAAGSIFLYDAWLAPADWRLGGDELDPLMAWGGTVLAVGLVALWGPLSRRARNRPEADARRTRRFLRAGVVLLSLTAILAALLTTAGGPDSEHAGAFVVMLASTFGMPGLMLLCTGIVRYWLTTARKPEEGEAVTSSGAGTWIE